MNNVRDITSDTAAFSAPAASADSFVDKNSKVQLSRGGSQEKIDEVAAEATEKNKRLDEKKVKQLTKDLNDKMASMNIQLQFIWHKEIERMSVSMVDMNTMKTIRSFPPEDLIKEMVRAKEWEGRFLDKKV